MLETLTTTAEQVDNAEPISSNPDKLRDQIADNKAIIEDMEKKLASLEAVRVMAEDLIAQHGVEEGDAQGRLSILRFSYYFAWEYHWGEGGRGGGG